MRLGLPTLFSATLFASAFLLFCIEPMVAKLLMPTLGGVPAVWNACLVFFQGALLAGYIAALLTAKRPSPRVQVVTQIVVLCAAFAVQPISLGSPVALGISRLGPTLQAFWVLLSIAGLPFLALATIAPTLQRWYAGMRVPNAGDPYFLYAASNLGSFSGLLAYPLFIEPHWGLHRQAYWLRAGFLVVLILVLGCALARLRLAAAVATPAVREPISDPMRKRALLRERARWVFLSAVPSAGLVAVTSHLTTDVAPIPLLWMLPLAVYLLSFIFVFASKPPISHGWVMRAFPLLATLSAYLLSMSTGEPLLFVLLAHLLTFFVACLFCHGELVKLRPAPARLSEFYVWMSTGGFIGGIAVALIAPNVLPIAIEYPLCILLALSLSARASAQPSGDRPSLPWLQLALPPIALFVGTFGLLRVLPHVHLPLALGASVVPALALIVAFSQRRKRTFALCLGSVIAASTLLPLAQFGRVAYRARNFFGTIRVERSAEAHLTRITHGTTLHGAQSLQADRRREPLTYYSRPAPVGDLFRALAARAPRSHHVGVIGLGAGTLAAYAHPDERWTFFEINPAVIRIATDPAFFTFLSDAFPHGRNVKVVEGDARLQVDREPGDYDLLVVDAFSSDAIPVHLVTKEALRTYGQKLAPGGTLAWHISNRHINLAPVLSAMAKDQGWSIRGRRDSPPQADQDTLGVNDSVWVVMSKDSATLATLPHSWQPIRVRPGIDAWTDDRSSVVPVFQL